MRLAFLFLCVVFCGNLSAQVQANGGNRGGELIDKGIYRFPAFTE